MNDYNRLSKFANLYAAHLKTRLGKRHKAEVIRFEVNLGFNLTLLSHMLEDDVYLPVQYYNFKVFEHKERETSMRSATRIGWCNVACATRCCFLQSSRV